MNVKRTLFFDLFHTLVDVVAAPGSRGRYTADILGVDREAWNAACFSEIHDITRPAEHVDVIRRMARSLRDDVPEALIIEATEERQRRFDYALENIEQETLAILDRLRAHGFRLGLISNASTGEVAAWERSPLARRFDTVVFSWECGYRKPEPDIYREALARESIPAGEALFIGDGGSNEHQGAREVGIDNVLITRFIGHYDEQRLKPRREAVRWEIDHLSGLFPLLGISP